MKQFISGFVISIGIILTCSLTSTAQDEQSPPDTLNLAESIEKENDTITYDLIIFDPWFSTWYARESAPLGHYEQAYLERWNKILTDQWNQMIHGPLRRECMPEVYLDYDPGIDYGKEFNHELYYFFKYMHQRCGLFRQTPGRW